MEKFQALADSIQGALTLFSYQDLRKGQAEPIQSILSGKDTLVIMPTGSGKSLCFQIPACLQTGITIVISPLIALMKDQVDALVKKNIPATFINSSLNPDQQNQRIINMQSGKYRIIYVAPERFRSTSFTYALLKIPIRLLAIDEAHCISEWGHDFRPDYRKLKKIREELGFPPTIALTATATPAVQEDIVNALGLENPAIHISGFERENLCFEVAHVRSKNEKLIRLIALLKYHKNASFVIYCATRKQCEEVQGELKKQKIATGLYHGGLSDSERKGAQEQWISDQKPILIATNAFGMGVDKSNVRGVIHFNIPGSLEGYYQEAGRAGRDGKDANCLLLFSLADRGIHEFFIENSSPPRSLFEKLWEWVLRLGKGTHLVDLRLLAREISTQKARVHTMAIETVLRSFQAQGLVEYQGRRNHESISVYNLPVESGVDWNALEARRSIARRQLKNIISYASSEQCRQVHIVKYFGGIPIHQSCKMCDQCLGLPEYAKSSMEKNARHIRPGEDSGLRIMRKVLAGIARVKGKRGAHAIAGMLVGSQAKVVKQAGLHQLSTFAILRQLKKDDVVYLLDLCTKFSWAKRNEHGCLLISREGIDLMKEVSLPNQDQQTFLNLTFSNTSTQNTASHKRSTRHLGTGQTYQETLRLHLEGKGYKEIAKERSLTVQTVLRHLQKLTLDGEKIEVDSEINSDLLEKVRGILGDWEPGDREKPLIEALNGVCTYNALRLHLIPLLKERISS